ncbi:MAG: ankyrin repeat domain-containing protein [Tumebacillaceae bacterium]
MKDKNKKLRFGRMLLLSLSLAIPSLFPTVATHAATVKPMTILLDGKPLQLDQQPVVVNDRTMVPFRAIYEALGATVQYDQKQQLVTASLGLNKITFHLNDLYASSGCATIDMLVQPLVVHDRTLVSVRFLANSLGADVSWDAAKNAVVISSKPLRLVQAIEAGDVAGVRKYLADGNSPHLVVGGEPTVSYALSLHEVDVAKALLEAGEPYSSPSVFVTTPVQWDRIMFGSSPAAIKPLAKTLEAKQDSGYYDLASLTFSSDSELSNVFQAEGMKTDALKAYMQKRDPSWDFNRDFSIRPIRTGNDDAVRFTLAGGLDPQSDFQADEGSQAPRGPILQIAAMLNHPSLIAVALQYGAKVNAPDANGWTALMHAAAHGSTAAVKALLQGGADPNVTNAKGDNALDIATAHGNEETKSLLVNAGGKQTPTHITKWEDTLDTTLTPMQRTTPTALDLASFEGKTDEVKRLLAADSHADAMGALELAVTGNQTETVRAILDGRAINEDTFYYAITESNRWNNPEVIDELLHSAEKLTQTEYMQHLLQDIVDMEVRENNASLLQTYLKHGIRPPKPSGTSDDMYLLERTVSNGYLGYTATQGQLESLRVMLDNGVSVKEEPDALLAAVIFGHDEAAKLLLHYGADPNRTYERLIEGNHMTPLMYAVKSSDVELVQALIQAGADVNASTPDGITAYSLALPRGNQAILTALQSANAKQ